MKKGCIDFEILTFSICIVFYIIVAILLIVFAIKAGIAEAHTKQLNCEHVFQDAYVYKIFEGEKLVTKCVKCGLEE